ncbi:MAG: hypothetical protein ACXVYV_07505 [Gaiellales bacterium]
MSDWFDMEGEMLQVELDIHTADRMLAGAVAPADAPPGYADVVRLLDTAAGEMPGLELDHGTVAAMAAAVRPQRPTNRTRSIRMASVRTRSSFAAAVAVAVLAGTTGLAFAGTLPGAAQDVAANMLAKVGVSVPGPNEHAGTHPASRGSSATASDQSVQSAGQAGDQPGDHQGKGAEISALAHSTDLTGRDKGAAISTLASGGHSHAGNPPGQAGSKSAGPSSTHGGTGVADTHSGGASSQGTSTADQHSGGHSSAGSGNASGPPSHP